MTENNDSSLPLPHFNTLEEAIDFVESHDMGDYWDSMPEVEFEVDIRRNSRLISIDDGLIRKVAEIANSKQVSVETLVELWIKEKVTEPK